MRDQLTSRMILSLMSFVLLITLVESHENFGEADTRVWTYARPKRSEEYQFYSTGFKTEDKFYTLPADSDLNSVEPNLETRYASSQRYTHAHGPTSGYTYGRVPSHVSGSDAAQSIEVEPQQPQEEPKVIPHTAGELPTRVVVHHHFHPTVLAQNVQHPTNPADAAKIEGFEQTEGVLRDGIYEEALPAKVADQHPEIVRKVLHHHYHAPILAEDVQHPVDPSDQQKLNEYAQIDDSHSGKYSSHAIEANHKVPVQGEIVKHQHQEPQHQPAPPAAVQPVVQLLHPHPYPLMYPQPIYPAHAHGHGGIYMAIPNMHFTNLYRLSFPPHLVPVQLNGIQG